MPKFRGRTIDNQPAANWPAIHRACAKHDQFIVEVRAYDEAKEISLQQMRWLHCKNGPITILSEYMGVSKLIAELILKRKCGEEFFVHKIDGETVIASKTMLSVKDTTVWIDNIFDFMDAIGCPVQPPDPSWRQNQDNERRRNDE
ncbi:MAG: hypothetical protein KAR42_13295 [candidate division Zixibacteria bacterium]|nr:hypothetical protein [candidate division Zixibacteria bacterium]